MNQSTAMQGISIALFLMTLAIGCAHHPDERFSRAGYMIRRHVRPLDDIVIREHYPSALISWYYVDIIGHIDPRVWVIVTKGAGTVVSVSPVFDAAEAVSYHRVMQEEAWIWNKEVICWAYGAEYDRTRDIWSTGGSCDAHGKEER